MPASADAPLADAAGAETEAAGVERLHGDEEATAFLTDEVRAGLERIAARAKELEA